MPSVSTDVDAAVVGLLLGDATLQAMLPDGVYFDVAAQGAERFVVVERVTHLDEPQFGGQAWELFRYAIQAVAENTTGADVNRAADRIHALLQDNVALPVTGYSVMLVERNGAIRKSEIDDNNAARRWQRRGGYYIVQVSPSPETSRQQRAIPRE